MFIVHAVMGGKVFYVGLLDLFFRLIILFFIFTFAFLVLPFPLLCLT